MGSFTLETWRKQLPKELKKVEKAAVLGLRSAAQRAKIQVIHEIDNASPHPAVNTGQLRQSVVVENVEDGSVVFVDAPHAGVINNGARPFWPPLEPLIAWVRRKGFVESMGDPEEHEREITNVARAVQMKIAQSGIEPRHYFDKAMAAMAIIVPQEIQAELNRLQG